MNGLVGEAISNIGDINNDGLDELAIGAPKDNSEAGSIYTVFGSRDRYSKRHLESSGNAFLLDTTSIDNPYQVFVAPRTTANNPFGLGWYT